METDKEKLNGYHRDPEPEVKTTQPVYSERIQINSYDHGFTNGVLKLNEHFFEEFILEHEKKKATDDKHKQVREELKSTKAVRQNTTEKRSALQDDVIENLFKIELEEKRLAENQRKWEETRTKVGFLERERKTINPYYTKWVAGIFIIAGLIFIMADVSITYDILHNALD